MSRCTFYRQIKQPWMHFPVEHPSNVTPGPLGPGSSLYHFHLSKEASLVAKPFMDDKMHGIFAIRGPSRPNPIGISVVRVVKIENNMLHVQDVDIVDGTPLLDIKPYVPEFDAKEVEKVGWLEENVHKLPMSKDDGRFTK